MPQRYRNPITKAKIKTRTTTAPSYHLSEVESLRLLREITVLDSIPENAASVTNIIQAYANRGWNQYLLGEWVTQNINNFSFQTALWLMNSFDELGYNDGNRHFAAALRALGSRAKQGFEQFNAQEKANLIYNLARANLFEVLPEIVDVAKGNLRGSDNVLETEIVIALIQADLFHRQFRDGGLFDKRVIAELRRQGRGEELYPIEEEKKEQADARPGTKNKSAPSGRKENKKKNGSKKKKNENDGVDAALKAAMCEATGIVAGSSDENLMQAIINAKVDEVKSILLAGATDISNRFLPQAWNSLLRSLYEDKEINRLQIIELVLIATSIQDSEFSIQDSNVTCLTDSVKARRFFKKAVEGQIYTTALWIFLKSSGFLLESDIIEKIARSGPGNLIIEIATELFKPPIDLVLDSLIELIWQNILKREDAEIIVEMLFKTDTPLPTSPIIKRRAFWLGMQKGNENIVRRFAETELIRCVGGICPLRMAVELQHEEIVEILMEKISEKFLMERISDAGLRRSLLQLLCHSSGSSFMEKLITSQEDLLAVQGVRGRDNLAPINLAAEVGNLEAIKILCERASYFEIKDYPNSRSGPSQTTPLILAAEKGATSVVEYLISLRADVNAMTLDASNITALHVAVQNGHLNIVRILLANHANVNAVLKIGEGKTPIYLAVAGSRPEICELLLKAGAEVRSLSEKLLEMVERNKEKWAQKGEVDFFARAQKVEQILHRALNSQPPATFEPSWHLPLQNQEETKQSSQTW